jgi:hypothetical protein
MNNFATRDRSFGSIGAEVQPERMRVASDVRGFQ